MIVLNLEGAVVALLAGDLWRFIGGHIGDFGAAGPPRILLHAGGRFRELPRHRRQSRHNEDLRLAIDRCQEREPGAVGRPAHLAEAAAAARDHALGAGRDVDQDQFGVVAVLFVIGPRDDDGDGTRRRERFADRLRRTILPVCSTVKRAAVRKAAVAKSKTVNRKRMRRG